MSLRTIVLATRNPGKVREIRQVLKDLPVRIASLDEFAPVSEPEEHGATFAENACQKALYYAQATGQWCLADDSGLVVDALGGEPGVRSARYAADRCPPGADRHMIDRANNVKLLAELEGVSDDGRSARFVCNLALADAHRVMLEVSDKVEGHIAHTPAGANGFGYDPLFFLRRYGCTMAELPAETKNEISHRGKALRKFAAELPRLINK